MKRIGLFWLVAGAAALALATASGASAQEEGIQEGVLAKNFLGAIGIIPKDPPKINYRERPPLVLPSRMELPAPVAPGAVESRVADWPDDPDMLAARREAADDALPAGQREIDRLVQGRRLSVEEVRRYRRTDRGRSASALPDRRHEATRLSPDKLRLPHEAQATLDRSRLKRRYLSDPPQSLLNPAAGAALKASVDPQPMYNPDSPYAFQQQQQQR